MEHSPSLDTTSSSSGQETSSIVCNSKVHYHVSYSYSVQCTHTTQLGQYPYMGYGLGLWMSTEPSGENGGAPSTAKMELKSSQSTVFNIL
jgi:hypothetical protein